MSHFLYLVRHAEPQHAEFGIEDGPLSERGQSQAHALGARLREQRFDEAFTSPLECAVETAAILDAYLDAPVIERSNLLFDCVPSGGEGAPEIYEGFFSGFTPEEIEAGEAQMHDAAETWLTRTAEDRHTLLITHNFVIGEFVRRVLDLPRWRWVTFGTGNCSLNVIRLRSARPSELELFGDVSHLPPVHRTGHTWFPSV